MDIASYFKHAVDSNASDLHLAAGSVPAIRVAGELIKLNQGVINDKELEAAIFALIDKKTKDRFIRKREFDFSQEFFGARFRINLHFQEGKIGLSARLIASKIPSPEDLDFNPTIHQLTHLNDGLILVTGPSGSGKSSTLAAMVDIINQQRKAHIITIEDPIEFIFAEKQSIIEQRELGYDTKSFTSGLKYALRQDPNVIMVGEMRDLETVSAALTAAETGHLVISTLHTPTAPETISRIVDLFPSRQQKQILVQLASILRAVIAQQLLPGQDGGLVAAREILINTRAVANLIITNQINQLYSVIQTNAKDGMMTMDKSIGRLLDQGLISEEVARKRKRDLETLSIYY